MGLTFALKAAIETLIGPGPPLLLYLPAVTFAAWLGGLGPGLTGGGAGARACASWCISRRSGRSALHDANDRVRLVVFMWKGCCSVCRMEMLHAARRRSEASAREARRYQDELGRSEGRLRAILDNSPSVIFLKDGRAATSWPTAGWRCSPA